MSLIRLCALSITMIFATSAAQAANSCDSLLCMTGKLQGKSGGNDCDQPVADYFSIVEYGRHGSFDPGKTATARLSYLNSCPAPDAGDWPAQINAAYGTVFN